MAISNPSSLILRAAAGVGYLPGFSINTELFGVNSGWLRGAAWSITPGITSTSTGVPFPGLSVRVMAGVPYLPMTPTPVLEDVGTVQQDRWLRAAGWSIISGVASVATSTEVSTEFPAGFVYARRRRRRLRASKIIVR